MYLKEKHLNSDSDIGQNIYNKKEQTKFLLEWDSSWIRQCTNSDAIWLTNYKMYNKIWKVLLAKYILHTNMNMATISKYNT